MESVNGETVKRGMDINDIKILGDSSNDNIVIHGTIHSVRDMGKFAFIVLRRADGFIQCVYDKKSDISDKNILREENCVVVRGDKISNSRSINGFEIKASHIDVLTSPQEAMPVNINKKVLNASLETDMALRPANLRNKGKRAVFKLQEGVVRGVRLYLSNNSFTEIFSPKIVSGSAEGGANIFWLDYFGKKAFLTQSPQFYKQMLVPVYERVFEIGPVFRAEKHDTSRHLNEYISVDFEMGFIESFYDVMNMETGMLKFMFEFLRENYADEINELNVSIPEINEIPCVKFSEAKEMVAAKYNRKIKEPYDLEPEEERLISELFKDEKNSEFVFVTHYPSKKRPFYAMDDPENSKYTLSFDLLYKGVEVTTGGQRVHDYTAQVNKMRERGLNPEDFESYLMLHKYGCPPHGGLGMGLERLCMGLINENNVRKTSLFPRDQLRLIP